jgi:hypothetical protein
LIVLVNSNSELPLRETLIEYRNPKKKAKEISSKTNAHLNYT